MRFISTFLQPMFLAFLTLIVVNNECLAFLMQLITA